MTIKILIGADICPTPSNYELFAKADKNTLLGQELSSLLEFADYTIFNLETPLTEEFSQIVKSGPCLRAPVATIAGLKAINPHFFTLANNHILDQGAQGLASTIDLLKQAGISYAGVGTDLAHMTATHTVNLKGVKIGIYCCAEHEFSIAADSTPGANPYDPLVSFDAVRELKNNCDVVVVLYHGGKEHYRYPSPQLQRVFRKFVDCGANLVIAQHTHCIGCIEEYKEAHLVYGQGNFLFDGSNSEFWQTNLLIEVSIAQDTRKLLINYLPCVKQGEKVRLAAPASAEQILKDFKKRSQEILQSDFIKNAYQEYANTMCNYYLQAGSGYFGRNFIMRLANKLSGHRLLKKFYSKKDFLSIQNTLDCEAHRELFLQAVKEKTK